MPKEKVAPSAIKLTMKLAATMTQPQPVEIKEDCYTTNYDGWTVYYLRREPN